MRGTRPVFPTVEKGRKIARVEDTNRFWKGGDEYDVLVVGGKRGISFWPQRGVEEDRNPNSWTDLSGREKLIVLPKE